MTDFLAHAVPYSPIIGTLLRLMVGFAALALGERYWRMNAPKRSLSSITLAVIMFVAAIYTNFNPWFGVVTWWQALQYLSMTTLLGTILVKRPGKDYMEQDFYLPPRKRSRA